MYIYIDRFVYRDLKYILNCAMGNQQDSDNVTMRKYRPNSALHKRKCGTLQYNAVFFSFSFCKKRK